MYFFSVKGPFPVSWCETEHTIRGFSQNGVCSELWVFCIWFAYQILQLSCPSCTSIQITLCSDIYAAYGVTLLVGLQELHFGINMEPWQGHKQSCQIKLDFYPGPLHVTRNWLIKAEWHIYVSVNYAIIGSYNGCRLFSDNPLSNPVMVYFQLDPKKTFQWNFIWNLKVFVQESACENVVCKNDGYLVLASMSSSFPA